MTPQPRLPHIDKDNIRKAFIAAHYSNINNQIEVDFTRTVKNQIKSTSIILHFLDTFICHFFCINESIF